MLAQPDEQPNVADILDFSLEDLMQLKITSASNRPERIVDAPATVLVITQKEIQERSYSDCLELLEDLPGMEIIRAQGDTTFKNYWRGYRNTIGEPFLLMVDGLILNHLYYNSAEILPSIPIAAVQRIEVVYGPASSIYGANAFMGVINIITTRETTKEGTQFFSDLTLGANETVEGNAQVLFQQGKIRASLTVNFHNSLLDMSNGQQFEYSKPDYSESRDLWGGFLDNPGISGVQSNYQKRAIDARVFLGDWELGYQYYLTNTGYGMVYPTDRVQPNGLWAEPEKSVFLRFNRALNAGITAKTMLRYRESGVSRESFFLEGYGVPRVVDFSYWSSDNSSISFSQDFEIAVTDRLSLVTGLQYENKDLQKAYETAYGPSLPPEEIDAQAYPFPEPPSSAYSGPNRIKTDQKAAYVQVKWEGNHNLLFYSGIRYDDHSVYGGEAVLRTGLVKTWNNYNFKLLYGEAFQEPVPRTLYGGWQGSGSDPDLTPEQSKTTEFSFSRFNDTTNFLASVYLVQSNHTILNTSSGAVNLGRRNVYGADVHGKAKFRNGHITPWFYYSYIHPEGDEVYDSQTDTYETGRIGDIATHKLYLGLSAYFFKNTVGTLKARAIGDRKTVSTNPLEKVEGFVVVDASITLKDFLAEGLSVKFKGTNIFDKTYFHPGLRNADSGNTPGYFDSEGNWQGSQGWYNSLLPQAGASFLVSLQLKY